MRVLLDTNVLTRMAEPAHPKHAIAHDAVKSLLKGDNQLFIVPQTIYEFWNVATRTTAYNGLGFSADIAAFHVENFVDIFRLLKDERSIYETWFALVTQHAVSGVKSFDARFAAAMKRHGLDHILTFNASDFRRYPHVEVLDPEAVTEGELS